MLGAVAWGNVAEWGAIVVPAVMAIGAAVSARRDRNAAEEARYETSAARDTAHQHAAAAQDQAAAVREQVEQMAGLRVAMEKMAGIGGTPVWQITCAASSPTSLSFRLRNVGAVAAVGVEVEGCQLDRLPADGRCPPGVSVRFSVGLAQGSFPGSARVTSIGFEPVNVGLPTWPGQKSGEYRPEAKPGSPTRIG